MMTRTENRCPFLVPVMADRLWMYPTAEYCRRPDAGVKVPALSTIRRLCSSRAYLACPGYQVSAGRGEPRQAPTS
jgi:hypothetical protein